jgi:hypothetical protein
MRNLYAHSPLMWIKVLPKEFAGSVGSTDSRTTIMYLALDRSTIGLFVIGAYESKGKHAKSIRRNYHQCWASGTQVLPEGWARWVPTKFNLAQVGTLFFPEYLSTRG